MKKVKTVLIAVIAIGLVVGFYYYLTNRTPRSVEDMTEVNEVTSVLSRNLDNDYPGTPREVVKFYNRALLCLYNEEYSEEEFAKLLQQIRGMMDEELLEENPQDVFYSNMQADVEVFHEADRTINTSTVCDSDEVVQQTVEGRECAYVASSYFVRSPKAYTRSNQQYILRKDDDGKWKILGFVLLGGEESNAEE